MTDIYNHQIFELRLNVEKIGILCQLRYNNFNYI